jgi:conjugal transfer pilus assembly protein TraF
MKQHFLIRIFGVIFFLITHQNLRAETFFKNHANGWHWYQELPREALEENQSLQPSPPPFIPKTPEEIMDSYKKELGKRFAQAWLHPTHTNVMAYQDMQKNMVDRSKNFSNVWMENVYHTPQLDHTLVSPVNQKARHVHLDLEKQHTQDVIKELAKSYGLFFFVSSSCHYCHAFAPIVAQFSKDYAWEVLAICADDEGGGLDVFPQAVHDNGLIDQWKIPVLPSLYAVNPSSGHVIPIAHGMISRDQMESRIMALAGRMS